jgi:carbon-monoxide dehydrogenase medium subunit
MGFEYLEPATLQECIEMLGHYGSDARLLAGGTDLVVKLRAGTLRPRVVITLGFMKELRKLKRNNDGSAEIGAMQTLREVERADLLRDGFELIRQGAGCVSSMQVRNVATLGGNSCNASPAADTVPGLIAADAQALLMGKEGKRVLALEKFFLGPGQTALRSDEILTGFRIPAPPPHSGACYKKFAIRGEVDLAIVGVAASLVLESGNGYIKEARIVLGAVGPTPLRSRKAEELLCGQQLTKDLFVEAARIAAEESQSISDQRASASYRKEMVRLWTRHALEEAYQNGRASETLSLEGGGKG